MILPSRLGKEKQAMRMQFAAAIGLLVCSLAVHAQMYRWTDEQGSTHYTDTPPPPSAKGVRKKSVRGGDMPAPAQMPYALQEAVRTAPVSLYVSEECGDVCKNGRDYLNTRGVPFTEKIVASREQIDDLIRLTGANRVPVLMVGGDVQQGYDEGTWSRALDAAGYPRIGVPAPGQGASPASGNAATR
jgi:glutaredoxin